MTPNQFVIGRKPYVEQLNRAIIDLRKAEGSFLGSLIGTAKQGKHYRGAAETLRAYEDGAEIDGIRCPHCREKLGDTDSSQIKIFWGSTYSDIEDLIVWGELHTCWQFDRCDDAWFSLYGVKNMDIGYELLHRDTSKHPRFVANRVFEDTIILS